MYLLSEFNEYLNKRRDCLKSLILTKEEKVEHILSVALNASATPLSDKGEILTTVCRIIGQALDQNATDKIQIKLGGRFINFLHLNKLVEIEQVRKDKTNLIVYQVRCIDDKFKNWVDSHSREKRISNITTKPDDWAKPFNRGVPIKKRMTSDEQHNYTIERMPLVYKALNALQNTEWTINSKILDVMVEGLPGFSPEIVDEASLGYAVQELIKVKQIAMSIEEKALYNEVESKYPKYLLAKWNKVAGQSYFHDKGKQYKDIVSEFSIRRAFVKTVETAARVENDTLYFQHNLDSRGRIYTLSDELSPQGPDYQKALLRFKNSGKVNEDWIKIHIANCAGKDKLSFENRMLWVEDNLESLVLIGEYPTSDYAINFYKDNGIDKEKKTRWQFIAACIELFDYQTTGEFNIPIGIDATSSGLQFFAAIGRDESAAEDVNISNCTYAPVGDIYQRAGNLLIEEVDLKKAPSLTGFKKGDKALRKLTKRSCMTYPYSCQGGSMGEHTFEDKKEHKIDAFSKMSFKECSYLGHLQYEVIQKMLPRTAAQMKAMQDSFLGYRGNPLIQWTTPVGFRASQYKPLIEKNHLKLYFDNRKDIRVVIFTETDKPNLREHKMGISPNVIHSLDASMMVMTLCKMID